MFFFGHGQWTLGTRIRTVMLDLSWKQQHACFVFVGFCAFYFSFFIVLVSFFSPVHTNPFSNENGAFLLRFQNDLRQHLSFSYRFLLSTLQSRIRFENTFTPSVRMFKWTRTIRISIYRPAKLARNWSHMVASVRHFGYSRSSGLAPGRVYFDDVTVFR